MAACTGTSFRTQSTSAIALAGVLGLVSMFGVACGVDSSDDAQASNNSANGSASKSTLRQDDGSQSQPTSRADGSGGHRPDPNPPAKDFDLKGSDPKAIELADLVMERMGGRRAWDNAHYITWSFGTFGANKPRRTTWDKWTNTIRVEGTRGSPDGPDKRDSYVIVMNLDTYTGRFWLNGVEETDQSIVSENLNLAFEIWTNDGYWMFMPYKLKDSFVTLKYLGEAQTIDDGPMADVIELTFDDVGIRPEHRYQVYIGKESGLVEQWDFFRTRDAVSPQLRNRWRHWQDNNGIKLSHDRGGEVELKEIMVFDELPDWLWTDGTPLDLSRLHPYIKRPQGSRLNNLQKLPEKDESGASTDSDR